MRLIPKMPMRAAAPKMQPPAPDTTIAGPVGNMLTKAKEAKEASNVPISENAMFCVAFDTPSRSDTIAGMAVTPPPYAKESTQNAKAYAIPPPNVIRATAIAISPITQKKIARGGTPLFEPGRDGKARMVGVRDPHWTCDLVCETPTTITDDDLPDLGTAFAYGGRSYVTTVADLTGSGDDSSTVRLTGRTMN